MSMVPIPQDINAFVKSMPGSTNGHTATSTASTITGVQIDRETMPRWYNSVQVVATLWAKLDTGTTVTLNGKLQHRSSTSGAGSTWDNFGTTGVLKAVTNATTTTGVVKTDSLQFGRDLSQCRRYVRSIIVRTVNTTSSAKHLAKVQPVLNFGGAIELPAGG